jgi:hypothetical protein
MTWVRLMATMNTCDFMVRCVRRPWRIDQASTAPWAELFELPFRSLRMRPWRDRSLASVGPGSRACGASSSRLRVRGEERRHSLPDLLWLLVGTEVVERGKCREGRGRQDGQPALARPAGARRGGSLT